MKEYVELIQLEVYKISNMLLDDIWKKYINRSCHYQRISEDHNIWKFFIAISKLGEVSVNNYKMRLLLIFFLLSTLNSHAQPLQELLHQIHEQNPKLKALELQYQAATFVGDQVSAYPDLQVNTGIAILPVETRLGAQRFKIGAMQMLPVKGIRASRRSLADSKAEVIYGNTEVAALDLTYEIKAAYYQLQYQEAWLRNTTDILNYLEILEELSKIKLESGKGRLSDVIIVQRRKQEFVADTVLIKLDKKPFEIRINRILNRNANKEIIVDISEFIERPPTDAPNFNEHPQIRVLEKMKKVSDQEIKLADYKAKPSFAVGLDYSWISGRSDVEIPHNGRDALIPMASMKISLSRSQYSAKKQEERLKKESINLLVDDLKLEYNAKVEEAYSAIDVAHATINKFNNLQKISADIIELMKLDYATEGRGFEELLRVQLEILNYQLSIYKQELKIKTAYAIIEKYN